MTTGSTEPPTDVRFRVLGHPLHASLVHLPLGVLISVVVWDVLALLGAGDVLWTVAFWSLVLGLVAAVPALISGLADYAVMPEDSRVARTARWHLYANVAAILLYGGSLVARGGPAPPEGRAVGAGVALGIAGLVALVFGGYLGAELVFRHRVGERRPEPDEVSGGPEVGQAPDRPSADSP